MSEIFEQILKAVPQRGFPEPLYIIANKAKVSYETADRYMEIILMVQGAEKIEVHQIGSQKGYSQKETRRK